MFARLRELVSGVLRSSKETEDGSCESVSSVGLEEEEEATGTAREAVELDCCDCVLEGIRLLDGCEELARRCSAWS